MKTVFFFVLAILSVLDAGAFETPLQTVETEIKRVREQRNDYQQRRKAIADPRLLEETDQVIAVLATRERELEAKLKELRLRVDTRRPCPVCGGKLRTIGSVGADRSKPSKNIEVWNRSMCGNDSFLARSPICTRCWFAQSITLGWWERGSVERDSFFHPLSAAIRNFPIPTKQEHTVYRQTFEDGKRREDVFFSFDGSKEYLNRARAFARDNGLSIRISRAPDGGSSIYVSTEK